MPWAYKGSLKTLMLSRMQTQQGVFLLCHVRLLELSGKVTLPIKCSEPCYEGQYYRFKRDHGVTFGHFARIPVCWNQDAWNGCQDSCRHFTFILIAEVLKQNVYRDPPPSNRNKDNCGTINSIIEQEDSDRTICRSEGLLVSPPSLFVSQSRL